MIGLDLSTSEKLAVTWIILNYYYVVDLSLVVIQLTQFFSGSTYLSDLFLMNHFSLNYQNAYGHQTF